MGSPSVSEAPRGPSGPSEKDAPAAPLGSSPLLPPAAPLPPSAPPLPPSAPPLPPSAPPLPPPAPALRLPPRVRLVGASADQLSFVGWRPPAAPLLLCPILLVLSNLSWLAPEPPGVERLLVSALGWSLTLLLAWRCRPRRARLVLRPATRQLIIGRESAGRVLMLPDTLRWRLTVEHVPELPQPHYRALLVQDERCWPLLVNTDPAELLRDLGRVLARWPGTVEHDWPLPRESQPWSFSSASAAADPAPAAPEANARVLPGSRAGRGLRWAMLIIPMLVMVDLMYLVTSASARVPVVHPLSVGLALLAAACLCSISASVLTRHPRLALGSQLAQEYSILGRRRVLHRVRAQSVRGVHVLTSSHARRGHLLVDSDEGALALLVESRDARPLQEELLRSLGQPAPRPSESAVSAPRRWRSA